MEDSLEGDEYVCVGEHINNLWPETVVKKCPNILLFLALQKVKTNSPPLTGGLYFVTHSNKQNVVKTMASLLD